jgi:metallophosphoesterase superfamily enzyme
VGEENVINWGWFMQWVRKELVGPGKITVISDQHLGIRAVFERPYFGCQKSTSEAIQLIAQNVYNDCHMKKIKAFFKQAARHNKSWRCEKYMKKI